MEKVLMVKKLKEALAALHRDDRGAMSVEKILILAIIALPIILLLYAFRNKIMGYFNARNTELQE